MLVILRKINSFFQQITDIFLYVVPLLLFILIVIAVFNRYVLTYSMGWYEELSTILYMLLVYWGAIAVANNDEHLSVGFIKNKFKFKKTNYIQIFIWGFSLFISLIGVYYGIQITIITTMETVSLNIPNKLIVFSSLVMGFLGMSIVYLYKIIAEFKK
jgi:TRAP-type transport system small permease protein